MEEASKFLPKNNNIVTNLENITFLNELKNNTLKNITFLNESRLGILYCYNTLYKYCTLSNLTSI